ncbi:MAG: hypothetical protein Q7J32_12935 [Sphingomonadaceae bacterium]|nr:hypothetical protein [Sphingomonadaceae bacterium]
MKLLVSILALALLAVATLLSSSPALGPGLAPTAEAVRRARASAIELAMVMAADGTPRRMTLARRDLQASAMLIEHGIDGVRLRPRLGDDALTVDASAQVAASTWANIAIEATPRVGGGFPEVSLRLGAWHVPPALVDVVLALIDRELRLRGAGLPPIDTMAVDLAVSETGASATLAVPRRFFSELRELGGVAPPKVDETLLRLVYGRLLAFEVHHPQAGFAMTLRRAFADRPPAVDAVAYNRAAFVALAMHVVDPDVRKLAGSEVMYSAAMEVQPPELRVGGRPDLAKHFILSAALTATFDPRFTRAIGEWKELDDSLPGGSGFSFVDLTADRAGMHLARAATDPATAVRVADLLADTHDTALFPTGAHTMAEGLGEAEFTRRYGGLAGASYAQAVRRVDRLLERLPLYAPFVQPES